MKAIVLLSGGIDSSVMLALALEKGRECIAISFNYGQRHQVELDAAHAIAKHYGVTHHVVKIDCTAFTSSSLLKDSQVIPSTDRTVTDIESAGIPSTYVPGRNTIFIAYAISFAEAFAATEIYIGANAMDIKPYPDCRPAFFNAFQELINVATKQAVEGKAPQLITPLQEWDKTKIIQEGRRLGVPLELTFSCYSPLPNQSPCLRCDACVLRQAALSL